MNRRVVFAAAIASSLATLLAVWLWQKQSTAIADFEDHDEMTPADIAAANYDRFCLPCHGSLGNGKGPAAPWLWPRPRNFASAEYKWRSTPSGKPPTDKDLAAAIAHGVPGTSMPNFGDVLPDSEIRGLVEHVKGFAPQKFAAPAAEITFGASPAIDAALVDEGKVAFTKLGCDKCHGATGKGDGPAAKGLVKDDGTPETTYDLTVHTFRRPRGAQLTSAGERTTLIYQSLVTGLTGTPMPSFVDAGSDRELWAVSAFAESIAARASDGPNRTTDVAPEAEALDEVRNGYWHGSPTNPDSIVWGKSVELQGPPPAALTPAQSSLSAEQCARCHAKQYREWKPTIHGGASSPGLLAQLVETEHDLDANNAFFIEGCLRCHAPLAEQAATLRPGRFGGDDSDRTHYKSNPEFDSDLQAQGINCASCHVRNWIRNGPPHAGSKILELETYPHRETDYYERSDFCLACHQLTPGNLVGRKPLLNTYREWLEGPYFKRGVQCQHCHMPTREHTWKGIHDPETFRQGIKVTSVNERAASGSVSVRVRVKNVGAGHYLPTTPTPAAWVIAELLDDNGRPIDGARAEKRIGRHIEAGAEWTEHEDTRIPPGETLELAAGWDGGSVATATTVLVTVRVEPDEFYERFYRTALTEEITGRQREMYTEALQRTINSQYIAVETRYPIR